MSSTPPGSYTYRCTEQQLEEHLQRVAQAGDVVEHVIYKGGRDYVLVCRPPTVSTVVALDPATIDALVERVTAALTRSSRVRAVRR